MEKFACIYIDTSKNRLGKEHMSSLVEQVNDKPWLWTSETRPKGVGGRPKAIKEVRNLARAWTFEALGTIKFIMDDPKQPGSVRLAAANSLLDRGWGKPESSLNLSHVENYDVEKLSTAELKRMVMESIQKIPDEEIFDGEIVK